MRLDDFKVEQWMNENEGQAVYNLTDTCASSFSVQELFQMAEEDLSSITLDYGEIQGSSAFRKEILSLYHNGDIEHITTCHGCLEANTLVMDTLLEPQDHVIACMPGYQQFVSYPQSLGCEVSVVQLTPETHWQPKVSDFTAQINEKTKLIILNNPNNPTGTEFTVPWLRELIDVCSRHGIYILCDEVYRDPEEMISISDLYEKGISTSSLSKLFGLAGLRLGWVKGPLELIQRINSRRDYVMISTGPLNDALGCAALKNKSDILKRTREILDKNKSFLKTWLSETPGFECVIPCHGTVGFLKINGMPHSEEMAKMLLREYGIFFVPGACFDQEGYMRLGLGQDPQKFREGLCRLRDVLKSEN